MVMEHKRLRTLRNSCAHTDTTEQTAVNGIEEQTQCPYIERQVLVVERAGSMVLRERYIQLDSRPYDRHEQLKQAKLEQRKNDRNKHSRTGKS